MFSLAGSRPLQSASIAGSLDFDELVMKYGRQIYNVAYRMTGDRHEAEDLTQETFYKAYKSLSSLRSGELADRWLYRIVSNVTVDFLRKRRRKVIFSLNDSIETDEGEMHSEIADWSTAPETKIEAEQFEGTLQQALNDLPAEFRLCLILCDVEGLSYEEISRTLNCNIGTVRSRIHRARKAVRDRLSKEVSK